MAGGYYTALSGMRTRMDALDRLAADIANASTAGYKTERAGTTQADRPSFGTVLQSAVDVANGEARTDLRPGALAPTGRPLDVAIHGSGFFVVQTPQGERYTRNGHLVRGANGSL
ncbi:MAG TPA: flagellar hook-basal body complex protein, partial [Vicinamibacterales bacterium]